MRSNTLRYRSSPETIARWNAEKAASDRDYADRQEKNARAWTDYYTQCEIMRCQQRSARIEREHAEAREQQEREHHALRKRLQDQEVALAIRECELQNAVKIDGRTVATLKAKVKSLEKSVLLVADEVAKKSVEKSVRGIRKRVIRDEQGRVSGVVEEALP